MKEKYSRKIFYIESQKISGHDLGISQNKLKALRRAARDAFGSEDAYEKSFK